MKVVCINTNMGEKAVVATYVVHHDAPLPVIGDVVEYQGKSMRVKDRVWDIQQTTVELWVTVE